MDQGRTEIDRLIAQGRLERVAPNQEHARALVEQARRVVRSAAGLASTDDTITAFTAAYDAARKALTAILANQGLRPGRGEGGHAVLREAVLAQLEPPRQPAVRAFGWMRQTRNAGATENARRRPRVTPEREMVTNKHYADLSDRAEDLTGDDLAGDTVLTGEEAAARGRAMLEAALGSPEAVDRALGGRPSLSRTGTSPSRTVWLLAIWTRPWSTSRGSRDASRAPSCATPWRTI